MAIIPDNNQILSHNICDVNGSFGISNLSDQNIKKWYEFYGYFGSKQTLRVVSIYLNKFNIWIEYDKNGSSVLVFNLDGIHIYVL